MFDRHFKEWEDRSRTIDLFRLIAILCVVLIHIPYPYAHIDQINTLATSFTHVGQMGWVESFALFLQYGLGKVASPALSLVSAWLVMRTLEQGRSFGTIIKSRAQSLLVPYVIWNVIMLLFFLAIYLAHGRDEVGFETHSPLRVIWQSIFSPFTWPVNGPIHYLRDLFIILLCYVTAYPFLKDRRGLVMIITVLSPAFLLTFGESGQWLGDNQKSLLPRADLVFYFLVGTLTYPYHQRLFNERTVRIFTHPALIAAVTAIVFFFAHFMLYYTKVLPPALTLEGVALFYLVLALRGVFAVLIFSCSLLLYKALSSAPPRKMVFRIFCSHAMITYVMYGVLNDLIGKEHGLALLLSVFAASILGGMALHFGLERAARVRQLNWLKYI